MGIHEMVGQQGCAGSIRTGNGRSDGRLARYPTANIEALQELPWPIRDYRSLEEQWDWVQGVPEVPGGYFTGRHLDNALREVVNNGTNSTDAIYDYVQEINYEIQQKRKEFKLDGMR